MVTFSLGGSERYSKDNTVTIKKNKDLVDKSGVRYYSKGEKKTNKNLKFFSKGQNQSHQSQQTITNQSVSNLDFDKLKTDLDILRKNYYLEVNNLQDHVLEAHKNVSNIVDIFYDTNIYDLIYEEIKNNFQNLRQEEDINDFLGKGTIADYYGGCFVDSQLPFDVSVCTNTCMESIPVPKKLKCVYSIYEFDQSSNKFNLVKNGNNKALIYTQFDQIEEFSDLSQDNISFLESKGIEYINILSKRSDNGQIRELLGGFISLNKWLENGKSLASIQTLNSQPTQSINQVNRLLTSNTQILSEEDQENSNNNTIFLGIILLIILFVVFIYYSL